MAATLPILIVQGWTQHSAVLRNISDVGAMIRTAIPLRINDAIAFHCGSIVRDAVVIWCGRHDLGIRFDRPVGDDQLSEQLARAQAVAGWRHKRLIASSVERPFTTI